MYCNNDEKVTEIKNIYMRIYIIFNELYFLIYSAVKGKYSFLFLNLKFFIVLIVQDKIHKLIFFCQIKFVW